MRIPRTAREFAEHGREVVVKCDDCNRNRRIDPELLVLEFGANFDCYDGLRELQAQLRCDACGKRHRLVYFRNARLRHFEPVSMDEATMYSMELSAYVRARGEEMPIVRGPKRRRR